MPAPAPPLSTGAALLVVMAAVAHLAGCGAGDRTGREADSEAAAAEASAQWFTDATAAAGLDFVHEAAAEAPFYMPAVMAGGAALLDFDDDGALDIYLTNAAGGPGGGVNRLYRRGGDGRYLDVTSESGLGDAGYGMGVAVGDIDNDGWVDVFVANHGADRLYRNLGDGTFADVTEGAGVAVDGWSSSAAFCDFDRDGYLDLYVTRYVEYREGKRCSAKDGRRDFCGPNAFRPVHDAVLRNLGPGADGAVRFADVSAAAGVASTFAAGLGVVCLDADGDGWQDVYVANDADPNQLWINRGYEVGEAALAFRDDALVLGVAYNLHGQAQAGMGVVAEDLDGNGALDLFLTHLMNEANTLYGALGGAAGYQDTSGVSGLGPPSMAFTGFGVAALDVELDGDLDLFVANGKVNVGEPVPGASHPPPWNTLPEPDLFFLNDGSGRFEPIAEPVRALVERAGISRAVAAGDVDGDGDVDLLVTSLLAPARLYLNEAPRSGGWLSVRALDPDLRRAALGARVTVVAGDRRWTRQVTTASSYQAAIPATLHFGVGDVTRIERYEVRWPDGREESFAGGLVNREVFLERGDGEMADG